MPEQEPIRDISEGIRYEDIGAVQRVFENAEMAVLKQQTAIFAQPYIDRKILTDKIPHFWPLVLENAPPEIEPFIRPSDHTILVEALLDISVSRFEIAPALRPGEKEGSPRSVALTFKFRDNKWFEECTLVKKFWFRKARDGWSGLVSEPVKIPFKKGKDLTDGLGDAIMNVWEAEQWAKYHDDPKFSGAEKDEQVLKAKENLRKLLAKQSASDVSFFTWFYFRGRKVSSEESEAVIAKSEDKDRERARLNGAAVKKEDGVSVKQEDGATIKQEAGERAVKEEDGSTKVKQEDSSSIKKEETNGSAALAEDDFEDLEDYEEDLEACLEGEQLAISISEDIWPNAIDYYLAGELMDSDEEDENSIMSEDESDNEVNYEEIKKLLQRRRGIPQGVEEKPKKKARYS